MNGIVVDASVVIKLYIAESDSSWAIRAVRQAGQLAAPDLLWSECANVLWKRHAPRGISADDARELLGRMMLASVSLHSSADLLADALDLALATQRTVYDCLYLALAIRLDFPLLTADLRFFNAVSATQFAGHVRVLSPDSR